MKIRYGGTRVHEFIEQWTIGILQGFVHDAKRVFEMGESARSNNGRGDSGLIFDP
jgi:hypothetical protein